MGRKSLSKHLTKPAASLLSNNLHKRLNKWDEAIADAKKMIRELKRSIGTFESLRDSGMEFPEPAEKVSHDHLPKN
jgi:hypothetical protein